MPELVAVEILHPEGSVIQRSLSMAGVKSINQYEDGTVGVIKSSKEEEYPEHRIHKLTWKHQEVYSDDE
jgi:phosphoribosylformylglycinamidine (FGAM) synthase PurS component